jgi:hydroxymethylglutaryl-CoA lyase
MSDYPTIELTEEGMREGLQIEDKDISVEDRIRLLDALSETGLKHIVVGSFVSPKWTPQMARIDDVVKGFHPKAGVTYTALALNAQGVERAKQYSPPLTIRQGGRPSLSCHLCDVFPRRNTNSTQAQEIARWPGIVESAKARGLAEAGIGLNAAWGSNWLGEFSQRQRMAMLRRQHSMWDEAGIKVTSISLGDPMSWNRPHVVGEQLREIKRVWPEITRFNLHLHNGRGMAPLSTWEAIRTLTSEDHLHIETTIGGIGGCPYCGNGRATGMAPTEDVVFLLEELGIETGVDLDKLVRVVWMAEEILGRPLMGHVSKAGPLPRGNRLYSMDMPFIETFDEARHFLNGPESYAGQIAPWPGPIESPARDEVEKSMKTAAARN